MKMPRRENCASAPRCSRPSARQPSEDGGAGERAALQASGGVGERGISPLHPFPKIVFH
jgi:hypothetical protein